MQKLVSRLRLQTQRCRRGKAPTGTRYPAELRDQVVALACRRQDQGVALARTARDLGLRPQTLGRWLRRKPRRVLRPVHVVPEVKSGAPTTLVHPVVFTAGGLRIEGLDLGALAALLRSLT